MVSANRSSEGIMKKIAETLILTSIVLVVLLGCSPPKSDTTVVIRIGDEMTSLTQLKSVSSVRAEILDRVKSNWDARGHSETEWIQVFSMFTGDETEANDQISVGGKEALSFVSTRSTPTFRIRKEGPGHFVVENRDAKGNIHHASTASAESWHLLEATLRSTLNDSILTRILENRG